MIMTRYNQNTFKNYFPGYQCLPETIHTCKKKESLRAKEALNLMGKFLKYKQDIRVLICSLFSFLLSSFWSRFLSLQKMYKEIDASNSAESSKLDFSVFSFLIAFYTT